MRKNPQSVISPSAFPGFPPGLAPWTGGEEARGLSHNQRMTLIYTPLPVPAM
jgi:hypothetical protein